MRKNLKVLLLSVIVAATMIPISTFADTTAEAANETGTQAATESTTNLNDSNTVAVQSDTADKTTDSVDGSGNGEGEDPKPEVKNGWVTENGSKYYYVDDKYVTGKQSIEGKNYFFSEIGVLQTGWIPSGSSKMYAGTDGVLVNGIQTISGKKYYFSENVMKTGIRKVSGSLYYFNKDGSAITKTGWVKCPDKYNRYFYSGGKMATGVKKISKKLYFFNTGSGTLKGKGFFNYNGKTYYSKGHGVLATKWQALTRNKKLHGYYFYPKTGAMAKNTKIGYLKIPKSGALHEAYALGIRKLNKTHWSLRQAYKNSYKLKYYDRWWRQSSSEKYALRGFKKGKGNCYVMAATFYIQAKLLGYNVHQVRGKVAHRAPHSWTVIKHGKKYYVYDPNFRNETGGNGWKIWYGKRGTWRYTNYHKMN